MDHRVEHRGDGKEKQSDITLAKEDRHHIERCLNTSHETDYASGKINVTHSIVS